LLQILLLLCYHIAATTVVAARLFVAFGGVAAVVSVAALFLSEKP
jgi:hypothetical protein